MNHKPGVKREWIGEWLSSLKKYIFSQLFI